MKHITIYTDGACKGNPGPGGWGAVLIWGKHKKEINGYNPHTTNNQMEMLAMIEALKAVKEPSKVDVYTDSTYVRDGLTKWIFGWKSNNWKTASRKPVKNQELWMELEKQSNRHQLTLHWVKGHSGDEGNEKADELANEAIEQNEST